MASRPPRHLAERSGRQGMPVQRLALGGGLLVLVLVVAAVTLLGTGDREPAPATTRTPPATTGASPPTVAPTTGPPAARPLRPLPGNLLADGDFERGLGGWTALGGGALDRVADGDSGRWAAAVRPAAGAGSAAPGLARREVTAVMAGTTYLGTAWVRAASPDATVVLALREYRGGREVSADLAGYDLGRGGWQEVSVEHRARVPGAMLAIEVTAVALREGQPLLVDAVGVRVHNE
jgi:hypothetical protein